MSQQLAIIVLVDAGAALRERTLTGNVYLLDNMKLQGSEGEGTGGLVTAINGTHWSDGSQANEQVLNWLPYSLGAIPPTVPRNYSAERVRASDQRALDALVDLVGRSGKEGTDVQTELGEIQRSVGATTSVKQPHRELDRGGTKVVDLTGNVIPAGSDAALTTSYSHQTPVITDVYGEAVEKNIIYPAEYGSPDMVTDGWYWSASVDSTRPGTYAYTMEIELHELTRENGSLVWEPVRMTCESRLRITNEAKRNGFTGAGVGLLPLTPVAPTMPAQGPGTPGTPFPGAGSPSFQGASAFPGPGQPGAPGAPGAPGTQGPGAH